MAVEMNHHRLLSGKGSMGSLGYTQSGPHSERSAGHLVPDKVKSNEALAVSFQAAASVAPDAIPPSTVVSTDARYLQEKGPY